MEPDEKKIRLNDIVNEQPINSNLTIEILNDDCLLHILEYLPICDRVRLERVSKRWYAVSRLSWKSFKSLNFTNNLWGCQNETKISSRELEKVLILCGKFLKVLNMSETLVLKKRIDMSCLLQLCPNVISVDFTSIKVGFFIIKLLTKNCKDVVELNIGQTTQCVTATVINKTILATYTNLKALNLSSFCCSLEETELKNIDSIEQFGLIHRNIFADKLAAIVTQIKNLRVLTLRNCRMYIDESNSNFNFMKVSNIKKLDISYSLMWDGKDIPDMVLSGIVPSDLEYLNADSLNIKGSSLLDLPHLKELSCKNCKNLKAEYFRSLLDTSDKLESVNLQGVNNIGRFIISAIESVKSRTNNVTLRMFVDKVNADITVLPDNLKLFECQSNQWYKMKSANIYQ